MNKAYLLFFLFLLFGNLHAQSVEELEATLKNENLDDTTRFNAGDAICKGKRYVIIKPQAALPIIDYMFELAKKSDNKKRLGICYHYYGMAHYRMGAVDLSISNYQKSIVLNEEIGELVQLSGSLNNIAILYRNFKETEKSLKYAFRSLEIYRKLKPNGISYSYNTIGKTYLEQEKYSEAMTYLDSSYQISKKLGDTSQTVTALIIKGRTQKRLKKYTSAKIYLEEAIKISEETNSELDLSNAYFTYASILIQTKEYDKALIFANKNLAFAEKNDTYASRYKAYKRLYEIFWHLKQYKKALIYHEKFWEYKGLFFSDNNRKEMLKAEYKINYDLKHLSDSLTHQNKVNLLIKDKKIETAKKETLWAILFFVCIITFCVLFFMRYKTKQKQQVLKAEIEANKIELDNFTAQLIQNNKAQLTLKTKLEEVIQKTNYNEKDVNLSELVDSKILTDDDWVAFKVKFNKVYPIFGVQIREKSTKLTLEEERLIIMNKLNLKNSEIAQIIGISPESIRKSRYRLKKKLNISKDISLVQYVEGLA